MEETKIEIEVETDIVEKDIVEKDIVEKDIVETDIVKKEKENIVKTDKIKSKSQKEKRAPIALKTVPMNDVELREVLDKTYGEHNQYFEIIKEKVEEITKIHKKELRFLIMSLKTVMRPEYKNNEGCPETTFKKKLSDQNLEDFILYLPVEMYLINDFLESKALDSEVSQFLTDLAITEQALTIVGGTEKERMRAAEYNAMPHMITQLIKKRVYYNLKNEIDAANKVYEALKKILTVRTEDKKLNAFKSGSTDPISNSKTNASNSFYKNK